MDNHRTIGVRTMVLAETVDRTSIALSWNSQHTCGFVNYQKGVIFIEDVGYGFNGSLKGVALHIQTLQHVSENG